MLQRGVARTTIEDIQEAADISTSQMYHYFADKNDLVTAVIDFQTDQVLGGQHLGLDRIEVSRTCTAGATSWSTWCASLDCVGGCPLGSMANELSETDPIARARLAQSFAQWESMIHDGLVTIAAHGELPEGTDVDRIALAMLAGIQGGLLLSEVRRETGPLEAAVDTMLEHLSRLGAVEGSTSSPATMRRSPNANSSANGTGRWSATATVAGYCDGSSSWNLADTSACSALPLDPVSWIAKPRT